jgi:Fur family peroxide stress response transcriptional regulator
MNNILTIFKEKDIRATTQRLEVYKALRDENKHLTVEQIYGKIRVNNPSISLATVYSVLEILKRKGLVKEIRIEFNKSFFETRIDAHHHFLCKKCQKTFDIDMHHCRVLTEQNVNGFQIEDFQGYFYGVCNKCKK